MTVEFQVVFELADLQPKGYAVPLLKAGISLVGVDKGRQMVPLLMEVHHPGLVFLVLIDKEIYTAGSCFRDD